jgi:putative ABC transport system permease protein
LASPKPVNVAINGEPVANGVLAVSEELLPILGIAPALGRGFLAEEDAPGRNNVVVISDRFWREHFARAPDVLGREVIVDQVVCTVVGVLPPKRQMPVYMNYHVFQPLGFRPDGRAAQQYFMLGQLRPGISAPQAEERMAALKVDLPPGFQRYRAELKNSFATMAELQQLMRPEIYWVLIGAVGFLYGIACLNATNLMLVRMLGRKRELSIRLALGGGRRSLIRLLMLEGATLSVMASAAGVLVANWLVPLLMSLSQPSNNFKWSEWTLDPRALVVLCGLTVVTSLAIVLIPALRIARTDILEGLKDGGAAMGESPALGRLRGVFVVLQTAFAVILLTGTGLMVRSLEKLQDVNLGFDASQRMKISFSFPAGHVPQNEARLAVLKRLQGHLAHVPGVAEVALGTNHLLPGFYAGRTGVELTDGTAIKVSVDYMSDDFIKTAGMTLKHGRMLQQGSSEVMVNEAFAKARFGEEDPIGQVIQPVDKQFGNGGWQVVGLVADVRDTLRGAPGYHIYAPETWFPPALNTFIVQVSREPDPALAAALKQAVYAFDPKIVVSNVAAMTEMWERQSGYEIFVLSVLKVLSSLALTLTVVGVFTVLAYTVNRRMSEFGIRLALGATSRDLVGLVLSRGMLLVMLGVVSGLAGTFALTRYVQSLLFETPAHDPVVLGSVAAMLVIAAALACTWPAMRATKADVTRLLRSE